MNTGSAFCVIDRIELNFCFKSIEFSKKKIGALMISFNFKLSILFLTLVVSYLT